MRQNEMETILSAHTAWLSGDKAGYRADLRGVDLRGVDLRGVDLAGAVLAGAVLHEADLTGADLAGADLRGTDLHEADLREAVLHEAVGFLLLPIQDPRGYCFIHALETDNARGWRVRAGCRDFSIAEALEHWGDNYQGDRAIGDSYLYAVNWLQQKVQNNV